MAASSRGQKQVRTAEGAKDDGGMDREPSWAPSLQYLFLLKDRETARPT